MGTTASSAELSVTVLRELLRNLQLFEALYETEGIDILTASDGRQVSLWDAQYLYEQRKHPSLSPRQRQAIELFLYENMTESSTSEIMGISGTNPIGMYATDGLRKIVELANTGALPLFRQESVA